MYIYREKFILYKTGYPISHIQYRNIFMRDSPHPTPPRAGSAADGVGRDRGVGGVGWGESLMGTIPYWT